MFNIQSFIQLEMKTVTTTLKQTFFEYFSLYILYFIFCFQMNSTSFNYQGWETLS